MKITFELNKKEFEELKDLIFGNQKDAYTALDTIIECAQTYGFVSLADYKDIAGVKSCYTDDHVGWLVSDLNEAHVYRVSDGYRIWLPSPKIIKN